MSSSPFDEARLLKLLGGPHLANLRLRLRARYERGAVRDGFTLADLDPGERRALAGLLGRRTLSADSMRVRRSELDEALARAGIASTLREALEFLDGPLSDRKADRLAREQAWSAVLSGTGEPRLAALLAEPAGTALIKRLAGSDPARAEVLLAQAARVIARLPGHGISRAQLAAEVLGDSHALDTGRPAGTIVLRACAVGPSAAPIESSSDHKGPSEPAEIARDNLRDIYSDAEETVRERWARLGVTVNELALPALCLNLPVECLDPGAANGVGSLHATLAIGSAAPAGEPMHISLRRLLRRPPAWRVAGRDIFVCENPNIVAIAADRLGAACAPLVCTDGMPAAAQQTLLAQLAAGGARLRYHGDFDWPGLAIANFVMRAFGAEPWRFATADYLSAPAEHGVALSGERVMARWDEQLTATMSDRKVVVHEEGVAETLLLDLA
jgi:uncharacterized protein (TIGR02679 family)